MKSGTDDEVTFAFSLIILTVIASRNKGGIEIVNLEITEVLVKY
jgi:hypothetical protein